MKHLRKIAAAVLTAAMLLNALPMTALAASSISSIKLDIDSQITSGDDSSGDAWNPNAPKDAFQVLGVPESASERQIKKAFHKLIRKYHTDLLKGRGLPEEMSQMYADKTRIINEAYETVRKYRNF